MNPLAALVARSAMAGTQRPAVGGGRPAPSFGPRVAAAPTKSKPSPGVADMMSRPTRARKSGYKKTAPSKTAGAPAGLPPGGAGGSAGPGVGGF